MPISEVLVAIPIIAARYMKWEITGPSWTPNQVGGSFVPFADEAGTGRR
jgi:hypothetical protein